MQDYLEIDGKTVTKFLREPFSTEKIVIPEGIEKIKCELPREYDTSYYFPQSLEYLDLPYSFLRCLKLHIASRKLESENPITLSAGILILNDNSSFNNITFSNVKFLHIYCQKDNENLSFYQNLRKIIEKIADIRNIYIYDLDKSRFSRDEVFHLFADYPIPNQNIEFKVSDRHDDEWEIVDFTIIKYKGNKKDVFIPEGVNSITRDAFEGKKINNLYFPHSIKTMRFNNNCQINNLIINSIEDFPYLIIDYNDELFFNSLEVGEYNLYYLWDFNLRNPTKKNNLETFLDHIDINTLKINVRNPYNFVSKFTRYLGIINFEHIKSIIFYSEDRLSIKDKLALKKALKSKSVKVKFALLKNKEKEEEEENEETESKPNISTDYLSTEIKELLQKIEEKKKYISIEGQKEIDRQCQSLINEYQENIKNSKPKLANTLNNTLEFGQTTLAELKKKLINDLTRILSNFYRDDLENLIKKIRSYQELLSNLPNKLDSNDDIEKKIWDMGLIIQNYQCEELKNNLNLLLEDTIKKIHKIIEGDLDDKIELTLDANANISETFNIEIDLLYSKTLEYQKNKEPLKDLLEDLEMKNDREFANELKKYQERIVKANDITVSKLFIETIDKYKEYIRNKLNSLEICNIDIKVIQDMIRYALSTINLYLITKEKTTIKLEDLNRYLEEALKVADGNTIENSNIYADIVASIKNKSKDLPNDDKGIINEKVKECLNRWIRILNNEEYLDLDGLMKHYQEDQEFGNIKVPGIMFKSKEIFVYYLIIKELNDIEMAIDIYNKKNTDYENAIKEMSK